MGAYYECDNCDYTVDELKGGSLCPKCGGTMKAVFEKPSSSVEDNNSNDKKSNDKNKSN